MVNLKLVRLTQTARIESQRSLPAVPACPGSGIGLRARTDKRNIRSVIGRSDDGRMASRCAWIARSEGGRARRLRAASLGAGSPIRKER